LKLLTDDITDTFHLAVIGGGRWGRTHIRVINDLPDKNIHISWITQHNAVDNQKWCDDNNLNAITIINKLPENHIDGVIIATKSSTHAEILKVILNMKIPVLCEKPFCMDYDQGIEIVTLSNRNQTPAAMNIEFIHASYLDDLKSSVKTDDIRSIEIEWLDPLVETQNGVTKTSDVHTPIAFDHAVHCWSLLYKILGQTEFDVISVKYNLDGLIAVEAKSNSINIHIKISRHYTQRARKVVINQNTLLDFSAEPGFIQTNGKTIKNKWKYPKPMISAISGFIKTIKDNSINLPESIQNTLPAIAFCSLINKKLNIEMDKNFKQLPVMPNKEKEIFLMNYYAHKLADKKIYLPITTKKDRNNFIEYLKENNYIS
jgi:hypothetical protein